MTYDRRAFTSHDPFEKAPEPLLLAKKTMSESKCVVVVTGASRGLGVGTHFAYSLLMGETLPSGVQQRKYLPMMMTR